MDDSSHFWNGLFAFIVNLDLRVLWCGSCERESSLARFRESPDTLNTRFSFLWREKTETGLTRMCSGSTGKGIISQIRSPALRLYLVELTVSSSYLNSSNYWMTLRFGFVVSRRQRGVSLTALSFSGAVVLNVMFLKSFFLSSQGNWLSTALQNT